jgi:membrane fusion protein (multidrug efflux system)
MWVYFNVPEAEYLQYGGSKAVNGMTVRLQMANGTTYPYEGQVTAVEADFNNQTGNIAYRATFPNPDGILRHGQTGKVLVDTALKNAMIVPQKAVFEILDKRFVLVVDDTGMVRSKQITVSAQLPDLFVVSGGLADTDKILLEGQRKVNDGDLIEPIFQDPAATMASLKVYAE